MATGGEENFGYSLYNVGTLKLKGPGKIPLYISIVICQNKVIVVDNNDDKVKIYRQHDGEFLNMLDSDSKPRDICLMDATTICVLHYDGMIEMASIESENVSPVFTSFRLHRVFDDDRGFNDASVFDSYGSVVRVNDNIVVVGVKQDKTYWCIASLDDGHVDKIHRICKLSGWISVTTKGNIIYILCDADDDAGVYAFDILNPSQCKDYYIFEDERLYPRSIVINEAGNIFVGNEIGVFGPCIHQFTASCELVTIFTEGIPYLLAMFWDKGRLYVACNGHDITVFRHVYEDQNPEKDTSFIGCINKSNFREIGLLLEDRNVPSKRTIINAIKEHGFNKGIQCLLTGMSNILRKQIPYAIRVWSGYRTEYLHTPVFVVMFSKKTNIPEKMTFLKPYDEYEIVFRNEHTPNDEEERISEQSEVNANAINKDDIAHVLDCIAKNTDRLMNEHSNLSIIAASTVKAMGFNGCSSKGKLIQSMCIVLYVPLKGIIPLGEKEFPKYIDGISTDVREGEFVFHGRKTSHRFHQNLRMGCLISTKALQYGTLGGFVDLPDGKTGCITAAHVVLNEQQRKKYVKAKKSKKDGYNASLAEGQTIIEIYQPTLQYAAFGRVSRIAFEEGNKSAPSVDAAVIEITNHDRTPCTGVFPSCNCYIPGVTKESPVMFNSGKTLDYSNISRETTVIKYGCSTAITLGTLKIDGSSVRTVNPLGNSWNRLKVYNNSYPKFCNQMVVKSSDERKFSKPGDSGALVFKYRTSISDLEAIGLLIGASTHRSSARKHFVTPIQAVFQQLRLEKVMFKCFLNINQGEHNEISDTRRNEQTEEINAIKSEIREIQEAVRANTVLLEQIKANISSLEQTIKAHTSSLEQKLNTMISSRGGDSDNS